VSEYLKNRLDYQERLADIRDRYRRFRKLNLEDFAFLLIDANNDYDMSDEGIMANIENLLTTGHVKTGRDRYE